MQQKSGDHCRPLGFFSRKLTDTESRYSTFDRELFCCPCSHQTFPPFLRRSSISTLDRSQTTCHCHFSCFSPHFNQTRWSRTLDHVAMKGRYKYIAPLEIAPRYFKGIPYGAIGTIAPYEILSKSSLIPCPCPYLWPWPCPCIVSFCFRFHVHFRFHVRFRGLSI